MLRTCSVNLASLRHPRPRRASFLLLPQDTAIVYRAAELQTWPGQLLYKTSYGVIVRISTGSSVFFLQPNAQPRLRQQASGA
jgi:hypothetical protein